MDSKLTKSKRDLSSNLKPTKCHPEVEVVSLDPLLPSSQPLSKLLLLPFRKPNALLRLMRRSTLRLNKQKLKIKLMPWPRRRKTTSRV
jgi:hypothetical protein